MTYTRVDGMNDAGEQEVKLMDGSKVKAVITRGDGETDADFENRIAETYTILAMMEKQ